LQVTTLIVPELFCQRGFIKPPAQRLHHHRTHIHFDLRKLHAVQRNPNKPLSCNRLCMYPFIRAEIGSDTQSFRGKEWCGTLEQAYEVVGNSMWLQNSANSLNIHLILPLLLYRLIY
jgi:hypothetical protein